MREIKFRVWNIEQKSWLTDFYLDEEGEIYIQDFVEEGPYRIKNVKPLQFTGIRDKNNVEIFEGNIIKGKHPQDWEDKPFIGRVFYWEEEGAFYHGFHKDRPPKRMWEYVEVIGNIYENPELLN